MYCIAIHYIDALQYYGVYYYFILATSHILQSVYVESSVKLSLQALNYRLRE